MISVVMYGRNDNYGYNLHKRAAISLNCLAEVLSEPDDELLFVDYNSPDDVPSFPEAIQDTLTATAKAKLRVLRARPRLHERFRRRTHLEAIEPVARNIAVRRSNPTNRWILSTNTDIIVVPRRNPSLSEVVAGLPEGLYHVPRFELPESLWESFDRAQPQRTIAEVRALGRAARLNDVVRSDVILYDGPGDFQLIQRKDLFAIDGFDEDMLLGWHVDSNIARRLILRYRQVSSLLDEVFCYHCDHTRRANVVHGVEKTENDWRRFVEGVGTAELPQQREEWGCRDAEIEEIRLAGGGAPAYRGVLRETVPPLDRDYAESNFTHRSFDSYEYDPAHVLPFVADLLNSYPRDIAVGWCGARADMFALFHRAWSGLGFKRPILLEAALSQQVVGNLADQVRIARRVDWVREADLLVFEFGRASAGPEVSPDDLRVLNSVRAALLDAVAAERTRLAEDRAARRFIGINCIHNRIEELFAAHVGITRTPFSSHLRHGFLRRSGRAEDQDDLLRLLIGEAMGRSGTIARAEFQLARYLFLPLLDGAEIPPSIRHQAAAHVDLGRAFVEVAGRRRRSAPAPSAVARALAILEGLRPSNDIAAPPGVVVEIEGMIPAEARPLSRFVAVEDWDDPSWARFLDAEARSGGLPRDIGRWERAQLLYGLDRLWRLTPWARVLAVVTGPDAALSSLGERVGRLEIIDIRGDAARSAEEAWRHFAGGRVPYDPDRHEIIAPGTQPADLDRVAYDVIVLPHGAMFLHGRAGALGLLESLEPLLKADAVLVFKAEIAAGGEPHPNFFDAGLVAADGLAAQLAECTGLVVEGGFDARLSRATLDKAWPEAGPVPDTAYLVTRHEGRILVPSLWFLRKTGDTAAAGWEALRRGLTSRYMGEQIHRLRIAEAGRRREDGAIATLSDRAGHVFFGPYLMIAEGRYRLTATLEECDDLAEAGLMIEALAGPTVYAEAAIDEAGLTGGRFVLDFEARLPEAAVPDSFEIRLSSAGGREVVFTSVALRPLDAETTETDETAAAAEEDAEAAGADREAADARDAEAESQPEIEGEDPPAPPPLCRTAAAADWDDPAWRRFAEPGEPRDNRHWERAHLLYGLDRLGKLNRGGRIAVAATRPDPAIARLSERVGRVDVLDLLGERRRGGAEGRLYWSDGAPYARDRLIVLEGGPLEPGGYDAVVFPPDALYAGGVPDAAARMAEADAALAENGVLAFAADIALGDAPHPDRFDEALLGEDGLLSRLSRFTGFAAEDGFDGLGRDRGMIRRQDGRDIVSSLWFLEKRGTTAPRGWQRLEEWLASRLLGEQIGRLQVGPAGRRAEAEAAIATIAGRRGHVFYGPYLALPGGAYRVTVAFEGLGGGGGTIALEVVAGDREFASRKVAIEAQGSQEVGLGFELPPPPRPQARLPRIEVRAWSDGVEAVFRRCRLDRVASPDA